MKKKPNRRPNRICPIDQTPFYASPSATRVTCSMPCRDVYYRQIDNYVKPSYGEKNWKWKGGRCLDKGKYWLILKPEHPYADRHGYVREHRLIMEQHLGRFLEPHEEVHHKDEDGLNNRLDNLELYSSHRDHWVKNHLKPLHEKLRHIRRIRAKKKKPEWLSETIGPLPKLSTDG